MKHEPNTTFFEKVRDLEIDRTTGLRNPLIVKRTVPMMYNAQGLKIRQQCSTCTDWKICKNIKKLGSTKIPYGRGFCTKYQMAECFWNLGQNANGKVLCKEYVQWLSRNYLSLLSEFRSFPVGKYEWTSWHISEFEQEHGKTIYGEPLS